MNVGYEVQAPALISLPRDDNSIAYGPCNVLYRRSGRAHDAHLPIKTVIKPPLPGHFEPAHDHAP